MSIQEFTAWMETNKPPCGRDIAWTIWHAALASRPAEPPRETCCCGGSYTGVSGSFHSPTHCCTLDRPCLTDHPAVTPQPQTEGKSNLVPHLRDSISGSVEPERSLTSGANLRGGSCVCVNGDSSRCPLHQPVTPQPKTEERDFGNPEFDNKFSDGSVIFPNRAAKDASAAEPERCGERAKAAEMLRAHRLRADDVCGNRLPCPDHPAPTVTHTTTPTEPPAVTPLQSPTGRKTQMARDEFERLLALGGERARNHYVSFPSARELEYLGQRIGWAADDEDALRATAAPSLQAPADEGGSDFAWVIERTDCSIPTYWDGRATRHNHGPRVTYHHDANSAVRFARQEDAERIIAWLLEGEPVVAREHGWFRATAAPSDPQPEDPIDDAECPTCGDLLRFHCSKPVGHYEATEANGVCHRTHCPAVSASDPQPSEQEAIRAHGNDVHANPVSRSYAHGPFECCFQAGREYERKNSRGRG